MVAKLKDLRQKLRMRMHESIEKMTEWLNSVVRGYNQYHAIPGNEQRRKAFRREVLRMWLWALKRRSDKSRWNWERFLKRLAVLVPKVKVIHPYPEVRFDAKIQGGNRMRYVASRIMWRPAGNPNGIGKSADLNAT
jgi:hypothetical protein